MSSTEFENKVTMGNLLTALAMLVAVVAGYVNLQARSDQLAVTMQEVAQRVEYNEGRIRVIEQASATSSARYESLAGMLAEVKADLRENNELLRQALSLGERP